MKVGKAIGQQIKQKGIAYSLGHLTGDIGTMVIPGAGVAGKIGTVGK
ncbi:MAG: hypothetical protein ABF455_00560 [Liquorilactobacillus satsumensis]|nr:hypothetical protein [Leuconostoc pseudomesenteroides]